MKPKGGDTFTFMYFGSFGEVNEIDLILDSFVVASRSSDQKLHLMMVGSGARVDHARARIQSEGLSEVAEVRDPVPAAHVGREMSKGDALLLAIADHRELYRFGVSANKMFDYLASGLPVVVAADFPDNPFSRVNSAGIVPPNNPVAFAEAMVEMANASPVRRRALGAAGRQLAIDHFEYTRLAERLAQVLAESLQGSSRYRPYKYQRST